MQFEGTSRKNAGEASGGGILACLEEMGGDCLERCKQCAEESEEKTGHGEIVVAVGCKGDTSDDGKQRDELGCRHGAGISVAGEREIREDDDEDGSRCSDDLVEGNCDELEGEIGNCDVDGVQQRKQGKQKCLAFGEIRRREIVKLHSEIRAQSAAEGVQGSECVREWEADEDELVVER